MLRLVRQLFAISALQAIAGTVTGVLAARSLGVTGRGELAIVLAPLGIAPYILAFGLTTYAGRSVAEGQDPKVVFGSVGGAAVLIGIAMIPFGWLLAVGLADGRDVVQTLIFVGVLVWPLGQVGAILTSIAMGLEEWRAVTQQRLVPVVLSLVAYVMLAAIGALTVTSAALVTIAGGVLGVVPMVPILRLARPPRFDRAVLRRAGAFGVRSTPITVSQLLNHRLDQVLMVPLATVNELGLYAVAVTAAGVTSMLAGAIATAVFPRFVREGEDADVGSAIRLGLLAVVLLAVPAAVAAPAAVPVLFGADFGAASPVIVVLLVASVPLAGVGYFAPAYIARDLIRTLGVSEIASLGVTVVGLLLFVPSYGAMGAAVVSLVAYTANFLWLLLRAPKAFGGRFSTYLVPTREELARIRALVPMWRIR